MKEYCLAKVVTSSERDPIFVVGEWADNNTIKVLFREDTEQAARVCHHQLLFGEL